MERPDKVNMEDDEMEMTKEELQKWIRENIKKMGMISPDVLEKCNLLQSLLERREKQAAKLLKLCESVAACEAIVKKQYSLLGWEYRDIDSDDDDDITGCDDIPSSPSEFVHSESQVPSPPATNGPTPLSPKRQDSANLNGENGNKNILSLKRKLVVVLTRLPKSKIAALRLQTPQCNEYKYSEHESLSDLGSETEWEPEEDSADSDYSISTSTSRAQKRRKMDQNNEKPAKHNLTKTTTPEASANTDAKSNAAKTSTTQGNRNTNAKSNTTKTPSLPANANRAVSTVSTFNQSSDKATKVPPNVPQEKVLVGMNVVAWRRSMSWQLGKVTEIVKREDGGLKYKIIFVEKRNKSLVSGHHMAFYSMPKVDQLYVGARVVIKCQGDQPQFFPGILAELPTRKNRMRFLVFRDDQTPAYVGLPLLHLMCRTLADPLDDIPDVSHRNFIKEYLQTWPYPPQTQYKVGRIINVEYNGVQQKCEVLQVDCSLIQIIFQADQHKEWIYRGSIRLEHMIIMREQLELKKD